MKVRGNWLPIVIFIGIIVLVAVFVPAFFQPNNLLNVGRQSAIVGVIAIGMTFVILTGGIDLSVGSILALSGVTTAILINNGMVVPLAMIVALLVGVGVGILNGIGVAVLGIQPFIMTLATMVAIQGLSLRLTNGGPQQFNNAAEIFRVIGSGNVLGIPGPFLVFVIVAIVGILVLRYLSFGRYIYAIGGSLEAARLSGVRTKRTLVMAYAISGLCAGLAGVMTASRLGVGDPTAGSLANLDAITAVVIGGTSLMGGTGGAVGTVFGALLLAVLSNVMNLIGISPFDQQIVKGVVIVIAVLVAVQATRRRLSERKPSAPKSGAKPASPQSGSGDTRGAMAGT
ncbi:ABC transporter permease [Microbacterium aurantiacum]|uniref:ABC transporter permease n=1 Tax=Microbacterium aurantiacum TaxID=162393 RepID=UPI001F206276|nr:ABC transporter permease [Microbacterium aurantiacum]